MLRFSARLIVSSSKSFTKNNNMYRSDLFKLSRLYQSEVQNTSVYMLKEFSTPHFTLVMDTVKELGFSENEIKSVIQKQPDLLNKTPAVWNNILGSLLDCGLEKKAVVSIINKWPDVLSMKKSDLDKNIGAWLRCNLSTEVIFEIWTMHPSLLQVHYTTVEKRIKQFQIFFETKKGVGKLVLLAPNVIEENFAELFDKLNYLDELCTEKSEIISSAVLGHSALHIRTRHEFLIRAGIYKRPGKEFIKKLSKNPKLIDVVNTSDKDFVSNIARLSMLEYEVFSEMYKKEYEQVSNSDVDSEDDEPNLYGRQKKRKPSRV
ncbi:uncharacterized protein LOC128986238 [Macrosteles quadrilineatus]|uniref:uncharacterized protein LOC128986238 n=1 Tax=Macrosteles quadrilineatus TaxID=74068 RepID=UPI0023E30795|nr:uncharacterized protein LOC128986238 [Macrosteles quadrilineatus]